MQEEGRRVLKPKTFWQQLLASQPQLKVVVQNLFMLKSMISDKKGRKWFLNCILNTHKCNETKKLFNEAYTKHV
jgi:hypothetical protein